MASLLQLTAGHSVPIATRPLKMLVERNTGLGLSTGLGPKLELLMGLSLSFGMLSCITTAFAFFWFVKIKRSFRHELIVLLIQADGLRSIAFVTCPIVQFVHGEQVLSKSAYCQASAFFMALGIEASDVAVVLIAVHSAMYIYRPRSGLYPYRRWAYAAYVIIPVFYASLAFADRRGGYETLGPYCYLSRDRGWSRLYLSWLPRYVISAFIFVTYLCIYIYVHTRLNHYDRHDSAPQPSTTSSRRPSAIWGRRNRPQLDSSTSSLSCHTAIQMAQEPTPPVRWNIPFYSAASPSQGQVPTDLAHPAGSAPIDRRPVLCSSSTTVVASYSSSFMPGRRKLSKVSATQESSLNLQDLPNEVTSELPSSPQQNTLQIQLTNLASSIPYRPHEELESEVAHTRERIRKQLRSLFFYPLIYILTWLFPLINQVFGHSGPNSKKPLWLSSLSVTGFAVAGFANSAVFMSQEKPWRHKGLKGFWTAVRSKLLGRLFTSKSGSGLTRDEMMIGARTARTRRGGEMMDESERTVGVAQRNQRTESSTRYWWDTSEFNTDVERDSGPEPAEVGVTRTE